MDEPAAKRARVLAAPVAGQRVPFKQVPTPSTAKRETYVVYVKGAGSDVTSASIKTLLGEYVETSENHGRKVYHKVRVKEDLVAGKRPFDVLLYYWDGRDKADFKGWWFGNTIGGMQVWAHNEDTGLEPPRAGWKIPWDGSVHPDFKLAKKEERGAKDAQRQLEYLTTKVDETESIVKEALAKSRVMLDGAGGVAAANSELLAEVENSLQPAVSSFSDAEKQAAEALKLAAAAAGAGVPTAANAMRELRLLGKRVYKRKEELALELSNLRTRRLKAEESRKQAAMESKDIKLFDMIMPEALRKIETAEDLVEKAAIQMELAAACADDEATAVQAVEDTDLIAQQAKKALDESKAFVQDKLAKAKGWVETVRKRAEDELVQIRDRAADAARRLGPALAAKQGADERLVVDGIVEQLEDRMARAELDADRAEEASIMLETDPSNENLKDAQKAFETAESCVDAVVKAFNQKKAGASRGVSEALDERLGVRGVTAKEQLQKVKAVLRGGTEKIATTSVMAEAEERVASVRTAVEALEVAATGCEAALEQLTELAQSATSASSADGKEFSILKATETKLRAPELAAATAQSAAATAKTFLQAKLVEVNRFSGEHAESGKAALQQLNVQLDETLSRMQKLKEESADRRRRASVKECEVKIARAERSLQEVDKTTAAFTEELPADVTPLAAREAAMQAQKQERRAGELLGEARRFLSARQIESRGKAGGPEEALAWAAAQARLAAAQSLVGDIRGRYGTLEKKLAARKVVSEAEARLAELEQKAAAAADAAAALPEPGSSTGAAATAPAKAAEAAVRQAQLSLRMLQRQLDGGGEALAALRPRLSAAEARLEGVSTSVRDHAERGFVQSLLEEVRQKMDEADRSFAEAEKVALGSPDDPSGGAEDDPVELGRRALSIDRAVQAAQTAQRAVKTSLVMKRLAVQRLSGSQQEAATKVLDESQARADTVASKLASFREKASELKMASSRGAR